MNPILKREFFVPDPEAHVMPDGRLYLYGSLDISGNNDYCSRYQRVFSTDDPKLENWVDHGICYANDAKTKEVWWSPDIRLSAPDCIHKDGKYYMYICSAVTQIEGVATADTPWGPFKNTEPMEIANGDGIDPSVFVDDDGQAYLFWGQFSLRGARLNPDMKSLDPSTLNKRLLTDHEHGFHEGASLRKRNGKYYMVYADITRGKPTCMSYAMADNPLGPYKKMGVIVDNVNCDPGNWNNHGSIEEYKGQWYVFYHRSSQNSRYNRRACAEKIYFNEDGTINEVEQTSQGTSDPINAFEPIDATIACRMKGNCYIAPSKDGLNGEVLFDCGGKNFKYDWAEYKYLNFYDGATEFSIKVKGTGKISVVTDGYQTIGEVVINGEDYTEYKVPVTSVSGIKALWLHFYGEKIDVIEFKFYK